MPDIPITPSDVSQEASGIAQRIGSAIKKGVEEAGKDIVSQATGQQNKPSQTPQDTKTIDESIKTLKEKDDEESKKKLAELRKERGRLMEHHEAAEQLGVQPLQAVQSQPTGPEIPAAKKLEPYTPLTPGKPSQTGKPIDITTKTKQGTRETKLGVAA